MQSLIYIWRNVQRNKLRTALTILSVGFNIALLTILYGYNVAQTAWRDQAKKYNRIVVLNVQGFAGAVPISYLDKIRAMEGVKDATPYAWFGGNYKEETRTLFAQFATDPKAVFNVWEEYKIDPEQLKAFQSNRRGCVVDRRLAEERKWKLGEKIPLKGTYYPFTLELELCGMFDAEVNTNTLWFNWVYLDESLKAASAPNTGNAGIVFAKLESANDIQRVCQAIDERNASSDNPTRSQTEAAFAQMFADMLGNVQLYIRNIGLAVACSLLLVAANALAMALRERTTEIAVLKAIGFSKARVLGLVLGESCTITALSGIVGVGLGCLGLQGLHTIMPQFFPFTVFEMAGPWMLILLATAAAFGLISGLVPSVKAAQLSVIDGLRRVV